MIFLRKKKKKKERKRDTGQWPGNLFCLDLHMIYMPAGDERNILLL